MESRCVFPYLLVVDVDGTDDGAKIPFRGDINPKKKKEIISIYPFYSPPNLTPAQSNRVCNVLALLQCVASHPDTRMSLLNGKDSLICLSMAISFALAGDTEVIRALLSPEIIPSCLRSMDIGCELSKTVATFILQRILLDDAGLDYICTREVKFFDVAQALGNMVGELVEQPSSRLMKYIIRCYLRLADNPRRYAWLMAEYVMHWEVVFRICLEIPPSAVVFVDEDVAARIASKGRWESGCSTGWRIGEPDSFN
ncbi:Cell differentiation protein RCD1 -like protein [Capsicum annuum]|uniref:Cell differentiation protein RCD1 -like protein n=1 Tax=Capsicum annuum TaxID=4072 RepID=A0A2G2YJ11_CAPAN|nr:Cell differentiation protein RCD1 -like protein [Capsicum annuum]